MSKSTIRRRSFICAIAVIICLTVTFANPGRSHAAVVPQISQTACNSSGWFTFYTGNHIATKCYGGGGSMNVQLGLVTGWSSGNNYGAFTYYTASGQYEHQCFDKYNSLSGLNNIYVVYLWLYENPYNWCSF